MKESGDPDIKQILSHDNIKECEVNGDREPNFCEQLLSGTGSDDCIKGVAQFATYDGPASFCNERI